MKSFTCTNCNQKLSFKKAFFISNFTKIKCNHCGEPLKPKIWQTSHLGGIVGGMAGLATFLSGLLSMKTHGLIIGIIAGLGSGFLVYMISVIIAYFSIRFVRKNSNSQNTINL